MTTEQRIERANEAMTKYALEMCRLLLPGGKKKGSRYLTGSVKGGEGESLIVELKRGIWQDMATSEGGSMLDLWVATHREPSSSGQLLREGEFSIEKVLERVEGLELLGLRSEQASAAIPLQHEPFTIAGVWVYLVEEKRLINVGYGNIAVIELHDKAVHLCSIANGSQLRHKLPQALWSRAITSMVIVNRDDMPKEQ